MTRRAGTALVAATSLACVVSASAPAAAPSPAAKLRQAEARLRVLDRRSETPTPAGVAELRATIASWRAVAAGYRRLGTDAATEARSPAAAPRSRAAWTALRDLAVWRVRQLSYAADSLSDLLRGVTVSYGAKEGLARMTPVEDGLRARLKAALAALAA